MSKEGEPMLTFHTILEPEEHWSDLLDKEVIYLGDEASPIEIVAMPGGWLQVEPALACG